MVCWEGPALSVRRIGKSCDAGAIGEKAPQAAGRHQHHDDADQPEQQQVPGAVAGEAGSAAAKKTMTPTIGPSMVPMPPITTMKMT